MSSASPSLVEQTEPLPAVPMGLPERPLPKWVTPQRIALGRALFHSKVLSDNAIKSCSDCHEPQRGYGGSKAHPKTVAGQPNLRASPRLTNLRWRKDYFWDGRAHDLPRALIDHWKGQMTAATELRREAIATNEALRAKASLVSRGSLSNLGIARALSAFVLTRYAGDSVWDAMERGAIPVDPVAQRGYELFLGKAQCAGCHTPPLYTDNRFHKRPHTLKPPHPADDGRYLATKRPKDKGAFRTPSLRGVTAGAVMFHNGGEADLRTAVKKEADLMVDVDNEPVTLTEEDITALVMFLTALSEAQETD